MARLFRKSGVAVTFLAGVVAGPFVKPVLRRTAKAGIRASFQARRFAAGMIEDFQDIAAEVGAESHGPSGASRPRLHPTDPQSGRADDRGGRAVNSIGPGRLHRRRGGAAGHDSASPICSRHNEA